MGEKKQYIVIRDYMDWETHDFCWRRKIVEYDDEHADLYVKRRLIKPYEPMPHPRGVKLR